MTPRNYTISDLTTVYTPHNGLRRLNMVEISYTRTFGSFSELRDHVLLDLHYPFEQAHKLETFGFALSSFQPSHRTGKRRDGTEFARYGLWRQGVAEDDGLAAVYADIDNANDDRPHITLQEVQQALADLGLSFFGYTTFSHAARKPKFRIVIDADRVLSRSELLRLIVHLDLRAFGGQADLSIYDPADFLFGPPYGCETFERLDGAPIDVDRMLREHEQLHNQTPGCCSRLIQQQSRPGRRRTSAGHIAPPPRTDDPLVRPEVTIANPMVFNSSWEGLYRDQISGSHWETMRSLLGMVWAKAGGNLSFGELRQILQEIDATDNDYFAKHHGDEKATELIDFIMSCPVEPTEDDRLLEEDEVQMTILVKEGECGQGKTFEELQRIVREKGRYVYVTDKIDSMELRQQEFFEAAGSDLGLRFFLRKAHSDYPLRVPLQLANIRKDLDALKNTVPALVFVSQQAASQMNWSRWGDFEIIMDEVPDCFQLFRIQVGHHVDMLRRHIKVCSTDGNCYMLAATEEGLRLAVRTDVDDYERVHHGLCVLLSRPNNYVWVKQTAWDQAEDGGALDFFALTSPLNLTPFKAVWLLGDEAMRSVTVRAWQQKWGVNFEPIDFARRSRSIPTSDRVTIKYVSNNRDSSITRYQEGDMPLEKWTDWIKTDAGGEHVLWTANERLKLKSKLPDRDYIPPKAHGRNDLQHYKRVAWLASMKASKFEIGTLRAICGMTAQELVDWREYNAMYQFVMRCILRDFDSCEHVVVYVFSRHQADYLKRRLGGIVEKVDGVVVDRPPRCLDEAGAMTPAERKKVQYWRMKMIESNVVDVRDLAKASKLSEREIRLVNMTHQSMLAAQTTTSRTGRSA